MRARRFSWWMARLALAGLALGCLVAAGCSSPKQVVRVESSGQPARAGARFLVVPGVMDAKAQDPKFLAAARPLAELLVKKGYVQVPTYDEADLVVYLAFAVKGTVKAGHAPGGGFFMPAAPAAPTAPGLYMSTTHERADPNPVQSTPAMGFMGGGLFGMGGGHMGPEVRYDLSFLIEAVDLAKFKNNDADHMVWQIRVAAAGLPDDMAKAMPYVVAAISDYIGKSAFLNLEVDDKMNVTVQKKPHHKP